jgi:polyketide synthase 12/epothilone polyketide synthase D
VLDDGILQQQNWERFARVMAPKVKGAWNLHRLTAKVPLDFFILFSSIASVLGSQGQANHSSANAFLDALAHYRKSIGLPALAINWGPVAVVGAAARLGANEKARISRQGIGAIPPHQAIALLEQVFDYPHAQVGLLPIDVSTLSRNFRKDAVPALYRELIKGHTSLERAGTAGNTIDMVARLMALPESQRLNDLQALLRAEIAKVLALADPAEVPLEQPLQDLGFDSLLAVEFRNRLATLTGARLSATLLFDYPTVSQLSHHLLADILRIPAGAGDATQRPADWLGVIRAALQGAIDQGGLHEKISIEHFTVAPLVDQLARTIVAMAQGDAAPVTSNAEGVELMSPDQAEAELNNKLKRYYGETA